VSHRLQALVTTVLAILMARAPSTIFASIPAWKDRLIRFGVRKPILWLPVPSGVPVGDDQAAIGALERSLRAELVIGHFGTCEGSIDDKEGSIADTLELASARLVAAFPAAGPSCCLVAMELR